jgi:hypothetical protein
MNCLSEFFVVVLGSLVANYIWDFINRRKEIRNKPIVLRKKCIEKIEHCLNELDFNAICTGGPTSPFKTESLEKLLNSEEVTFLDENLTLSIKKIINYAGLARAPHQEYIAVKTKQECKHLKELLEKKKEELKLFH